MNEYDLKIYDRISELLSLLMNPDFEASIKSISKATETTCEQTREDIRNLAAAGLDIWPPEVVSRLSSSESAYDEEILELDTELPGIDIFTAPFLMMMTPLEKTLFKAGRFKGFVIKDSPLMAPPDVEERKQVIESAIEKGVCIQFRYPIPGESRTEQLTVAPRMVLHNMTDELYYCVTFTDDGQMVAFRLDRMRYSVRLLSEKKVSEIDPADPRFKRLEHIWGSDFANEEDPIHVKIRITKNTPNILRKIKADISGRKHARLYQRGDYWYYEDDIIGQSSFRSWLMLFGSSVKVMEPQSMAEQIKLSSMHRLQNYKEGRFCEIN